MKQARRGSNVIEFALVLPVALALLSGIVDLGWYFNQNFAVLAAVRAGVQVGSGTLQSSDPLAQARLAAEEAWSRTLHAETSTPTFTAVFSGANPMQVILVTAAMPNAPLIGLVSLPTEHRVTFAMRMAEQP